MRKVKIAICSCFCFAAQTVNVSAQDTTLTHYDLKPVPIVGADIKIRIIQSGARIDVTDSTLSRIYPAGTLSDLLGSGGMMNLKSYGPGALSTTASRGANSMQMPIIWNGLNLQNITNNTVDLSLMPTFLFDQVAVQPGSSSAAWGSGAIGGVIRVSTWPVPRFPSGRLLVIPYLKQKVVFEYGSFGSAMGGYQCAWGKGGWNYDLKVFRQFARNAFPYTNIAVVNSPVRFLDHAQSVQQGLMASTHYMSSDYKRQFGLNVWVQETRREIPPTMLQSVSESTQQDYALRIVANFIYYPKDQLSISSRVGLIHEGLLYDAGFNQPLSNTDQWTVIAASDIRYYTGQRNSSLWKNISLTGGVSGSLNSAIVTGFVPYTQQFRVSAFFSVGKYLRENDEMNISIRQELVDDQLIDPVGTFWYYLHLRKWFGVRACVTHNYRVPTFNDLYWVPGGNPDLRAETSWTEEVTLELKPQWKKVQLTYSCTVYNREVRDMITWVPLAAYWSPQNVTEVRSRGAEHRFRMHYHVMKWKFTLLANADYTRSTYEKSESPNDASIGKQLIYVPAWFGGGSFTAQWTDFFVTYSQQYTDLRFTTRDHLEWLPAYSIGSAAFGWSHLSTVAGGEYQLNLFVRCNNIADVQYQAVAWRPMPGRNYMIGCTLEFGKQLMPKTE